MKKTNIYQKLHKIQSKINGLGKDKATNTYKYVTGDKVLGEIKPMMNDLGLILKQEIISIENVRQDYIVGINTTNPAGRPKSEILSKVMMRFTWVDIETGEKDENLFGSNGQNDWDKGVGSALTYGERYFLLKYFHIATDEDDIDNKQTVENHGPVAATKPEPAKPATASKTPMATPEQKAKILKLMIDATIDTEEKSSIAERLNNNKMTSHRADECIGYLEGKVPTIAQ
jgi:hypothetical protein